MHTNIVKAIDAVEGMKELNPDSVDLTITSPPYDDIRDYKNGHIWGLRSVVNELYRVTKPGGVVVWIVADQVKDGSETGNSFRQALSFIDGGFKLNDTMIYEKTGTTYEERGNRYNQIFDFMFIFSKGTPLHFNRIKDVPKLWEGFWGKSTRRQKDGTLKENLNKCCGMGRIRDDTGKYGWKQILNIWKYISGGKFKHPDFDIARKHPATFPFKLAEDHIISWSHVGDTVLDPFCGSGTTGVAAKKHNRNYIMFDISQEYIDISNERLQAFIS